MQTGEIIVSSAEEILQQSRIHLLAVQRKTLQVSVWSYSLCSPFWRIYVNERSGAFLTYEGGRLEIPAGACCLIPAWTAFETGLRRSVTQNFAHFTWMGFSSVMLRRIFSGPILLRRDDLVQLLIARWRARLATGELLNLEDFSLTYSLIYAALSGLLAQLPESSRALCFGWLSRSAAVQPALTLLEVRLNQPPSLAEMAAACHASPNHFIRTFRRVVGLTPLQYGLERRIACAAQWLAESSRSIEQIAESTGFADRFHFSKAFKARLSLSPAAYRRLHFSSLGHPDEERECDVS